MAPTRLLTEAKGNGLGGKKPFFPIADSPCSKSRLIEPVVLPLGFFRRSPLDSLRVPKETARDLVTARIPLDPL